MRPPPSSNSELNQFRIVLNMNGKQVLTAIGVGLVGGAGVFWYTHKDEPGEILDQIIDAVVTLTTTDESRLAQLQPDVEAAVRAVIADAVSAGFAVKVGQTLRTSAQEKIQIDAGRTSATQTHSWHQIGRAVDLYVIDPTTGDVCYKGQRPDLALQLARFAEARGFRQLGFNADGSPRYINGKKGPIWDVGHIEYRAPYGTLAQAIAAEGPHYGIG